MQTNQPDIQQNTWKHMAGEAAAELVEDGMVIGLGSGSTAAQLIYALAQRIQNGLSIIGAVPSSQATADLASNLNIPLTTLDAHPILDLAIDGADEIDNQLGLIKGGGGALLREKIVATAAKRFVIIGDVTKLVSQLGTTMPLPLEVVPFAAAPVRNQLEMLGLTVQLRQSGDQTFITDNGNIIFDCIFPQGISDPDAAHARIRGIVGVIDTGLFLHIANQAIIGGPQGIRVITV